MIKTLSILCALMLAFGCQPKTATQTSAPVDSAKVEQLKKLLAEQANQATTETEDPTKSPTQATEDGDPTRIVSIRVVPSSLSLIEALSSSIAVLGTQANGQERTLSTDVSISSANPDIAEGSSTADSARFKINTFKPGIAQLTAKFAGFDANFSVEVKAKQVVSIEIYPKSVALGTPTRFKVLASYDNSSKSEVNDSVSWQSMNPTSMIGDGNSATSGIFTGAKVGLAGVRASYQGMTIITRIDVQMPKIEKIEVQAETDSFLLGTTDVPVSAIATFAGGNTYNIASSVSWTVIDPTIVSVSSSGDLEALFPGDTQVKATYGKISGQATFFVTSQNFVSYRVDPTTATIPVGLSTSFKLYGKKADNTEVDISNYARWTVDDATVAQSGTTMTPKQPGKMLGLQIGTTPIKARYGTNTATANLTVSAAAVLSLSIATDNPEGACGINEPIMRVEGSLSDGSSKDLTDSVTYTVDPVDLAIPRPEANKKGYISTKKAGTGRVIASYLENATGQTLTAEKAIISGPAEQTGVGIVAPQASVAHGEAVPIKLAQILSCGDGADFTNSSSWTTDNGSLTMNNTINATASKGLLLTLDMANPPASGTVPMKITAVKGSLQAELTLTIREKEVRTITVSPAATEIDVGTTTAISLSSRFSDNSVVNMSDISQFPGYTVQYSVTDCVETGCATINAATGLLTAGSKEGIVQVFASLNTPQGFSLLSVKTDVSVRSKCAQGVRAGLYCVFKSARAASCNTACAAIGGTYHTATSTEFGKAAPTNASCEAALQGLGYANGLDIGSQNAYVGVGCSIWNINALNIRQSVFENVTNTTGAASHADYERVCACTEP